MISNKQPCCGGNIREIHFTGIVVRMQQRDNFAYMNLITQCYVNVMDMYRSIYCLYGRSRHTFTVFNHR